MKKGMIAADSPARAGRDENPNTGVSGRGVAADPFMAAVYATPTAMVITDARRSDNPVVFVNDAFCRLTGYTPPEVLGRNCRFLQGPQSDRGTVARIRDALAADAAIQVDVQNHRKDGAAFWNRLVITPVRDPAGAVVYFVASQSDVTLELNQLPILEARNAALLKILGDRLSAQNASEARFHHMADNAPVMVWTSDVSGNCTWLSQSWKVFTGKMRAEGLGTGWLSTVHPDDFQRVADEHARSIATQVGGQIEYRLRKADETYAWVIDASAARFAEDGAPMGFVGSVLDVTARRSAEERLVLSEASLRLATDAADVGTWDIDLATGTTNLSQRGRLIFGLPLDAAIASSDLGARIHPDDRAAREAAFAGMIDPAIRAPYDIEIRTVYQEDGSFRWVALKGKGLFLQDGRCASAYGTTIDITARKLSQARQMALLSIADRIRKLTATGAIACAMRDVLGPHFDTDHVGFASLSAPDTAALEGANRRRRASAALLGVLTPAMMAQLANGETLVCSQPRDSVNPPCPVCTVMGVQSLAVLPLLRDGTLAALTYIGHTRQRRWTSGDQTLGALVIAHGWDAMERARAEGSLRELNATLESRVAERTAALQNAEESLRQAQKMEAVGQLTGGIAHDFNNLLTGIVGSLDILESRIAAGHSDGLQRYIATAIASAQRAGTLTQRLLAFARRQPLDPRPTDVNALIAGMAEMLRRTLGPGVSLELLLLCEGLWPTLCDANQLESAILNLAINARDAMPDGGTLTIATENAMLDAEAAGAAGATEPGEYTVIRVADTGAGMTPDIMMRAFEPFFTTKPIGQGTGLGLSMLYGFAKQSGGHVQLASEYGSGTRLSVFLPRHHGLQAPSRTGWPAVATDGPSHGTVLVVDDESAVRSLVVETLEECGFTTLQAADGTAGLHILQSTATVDLLVTDVGLPGLNGRQVADAARALRPGLKVLFITGYTHNAAMGQGALEPGMEMMTKPFRLAALTAKITAMLAPG